MPALGRSLGGTDTIVRPPQTRVALSYRLPSSPSPEVRDVGRADHVRMINPHDVVLITGASKGLGLALARQLAKRKHPLVLNARGAEVLERVTKELSAQTE